MGCGDRLSCCLLVVAAALILTAPVSVVTLLIGCIVIDSFDILTAILSGMSGAYDTGETIGLMTTAILALIPEGVALFLILRGRHRSTTQNA